MYMYVQFTLQLHCLLIHAMNKYYHKYHGTFFALLTRQ